MIGIIGALKEEIELIKEKIGYISHQEFLGSNFYPGIISKKEVVVSQSSIGKINAATTTATMILKYNPDIIINTGISGSLHNSVNILDIIIANKISLHDESEVFNRYFPFYTSFNVEHKYIDLILDNYNNQQDTINIYTGEVISGDSFIDNNEKKQFLKKKFPNSLAVDMESGAIAKVCFKAKTDFIVIKTISDQANDQANINYDQFINLASQRSSKLVLDLISKL